MSIPEVTCQVQFEQLHMVAPHAPRAHSFGVGMTQSGARVLAPAQSGGSQVQDVDPHACIAIPDGLATANALVLPQLAHALWAWDKAALELGEAAAITSGSADGAIYCQVASWRSGRTPLYLDVDADPRITTCDADVISAADPERAIEALSAALASTPGAAVVLLSSGAAAANVLLEAIPMWGRMVLAAGSAEPTAVDFYNHVHRRGVRLIGMNADPASVFDPDLRETAAPHVRRALAILEHGALAACCMKLVA